MAARRFPPIRMTDRTDESLIAAADEALRASTERVVLVEHRGERYVAKRTAGRPRRLGQALFVRWLVRRVTGEALPMRALRLAEAASSVDYEARRLEALARAGVRVPRIVHRGSGYLLLEHCGTSVASQIDAWPVDTCRRELRRLVDELAAFHRAGHWHGAAQIKNLTTRDGQTWRIDFEEDFGERVPLPAAQALDVVLLLNSISLAGPLVEAETRKLLPELLRSYLAGNPDRRVREVLERALPWVAGLARLAAPFRGGSVGGRPRKGIARVVILVETLAAVLGER
jgi:tRNA A-37 threonylcarbamoyl transferase component Bud32